MNHLTPEQALADNRAVRRDRTDSHWLDCACVLADEVSRYKDEELDNAEVNLRLCKATVRVAEALGFSESCVMGHKRQGEFALEAVARLVESERLQMHGYKREDESLREENAKLRAELDALKVPSAAPEPPALARFLPVRPDDVPAPPDGWVYVGMGFEQPYGTKESKDISALLEWCAEWNVGQAGRDPCKHYAIRWTAPADIWRRFGLLAPSEGGGWIPHTPFTSKPDNADANADVLMDMQGGEKVACFCPTNEWQNFPVIGWRPAVEVAT